MPWSALALTAGYPTFQYVFDPGFVGTDTVTP